MKELSHFWEWARKHDWGFTVIVAAIVTLAFPASYGVYTFQLLFFPLWVAIISAASFELVYIGLATQTRLNEERRAHAIWISLSAVAVSIVYNTLSALFKLQPDITLSNTVAWSVILAILHGAPLAVTAFFVAHLILHKDVGHVEGTGWNDMKESVIARMLDRGFSQEDIYKAVGGNRQKTIDLIKAIQEDMGD